MNLASLTGDAAPPPAQSNPWLWILLVIVLVIVALYLWRRRR